MKDYSRFVTKKTPPVDDRNFFLRLLTSIRPAFGIKGKVDGKSGKIKHNITIGVKGSADF